MSHPLTFTNAELKLFTDSGSPEKVQHVWNSFPDIRAEFPTFEVFASYVWALSHDQVHTCHGGGVTSMVQPSTVKGRL